MFIQTRGPLAACLLNDYVLKKCLLIIWGAPGARGPGARAPMAPLLIRHWVYAVQAPQWQRASGATGVFGPYCCALRDYDETFTGDANRGNFLAMLKLTAQMQHTFQHEANIRPTSLTSLVEELSESHFYGKSMHAWGQIVGNHD